MTYTRLLDRPFTITAENIAEVLAKNVRQIYSLFLWVTLLDETSICIRYAFSFSSLSQLKLNVPVARIECPKPIASHGTFRVPVHVSDSVVAHLKVKVLAPGADEPAQEPVDVNTAIAVENVANDPADSGLLPPRPAVEAAAGRLGLGAPASTAAVKNNRRKSTDPSQEDQHLAEIESELSAAEQGQRGSADKGNKRR